jgi:cellulose synthase/poly-beta-1,6-N-acetylglucosamine synthase-like glycosyltransferase
MTADPSQPPRVEACLSRLGQQRAFGQISQQDYETLRARLLGAPDTAPLEALHPKVVIAADPGEPPGVEARLARLGQQRAFGQLNEQDYETLRALLLGATDTASLEALRRNAATTADPNQPRSNEARLARLGQQRAFGQLSQQDYETLRALLLPALDTASGTPRPTDTAAPSPRRGARKRLSSPQDRTEDWATWGAARDGARVVLTRPQVFALALLSLLVPILLLVRTHFTLIAVIALVTALYVALGVHRISLLIRGERGFAKAAAYPQPATAEDLPIYTVLVPLYHEARILPALVERLTLIDYPPSRLDILLLIEKDDVETLHAAHNCTLPRQIGIRIMPPGQPRTKPRALNVGLRDALGEYIVIYDAEDQPEPDQLRKAVAAFRSLPADVVCLQARLNFYNRHQSLLTRLFAVDYATWYDQLLPGLTHSRGVPSGLFAPLGGTSNHFRVDTVRNIGGWDPFNVTEDCDVGVRLGRAGLRVAMLDSVTWEEAVARVKPWIRQRSRWVKGYMQTYLVHMRHPRLLWKQLGLRGFVDFQILVGGSSLALLLNPLMWMLTALYLAEKGTHVGSVIETLFPAALYYPALFSLVVLNFILFYCNAYVCVRHNYIDLTRYTVLTPVYWMLMSVGAWVGLFSLIRNPFYWAKTEHGIGVSAMDGAAPLPVGYTHADHSVPAQARTEQ